MEGNRMANETITIHLNVDRRFEFSMWVPFGAGSELRFLVLCAILINKTFLK